MRRPLRSESYLTDFTDNKTIGAFAGCFSVNEQCARLQLFQRIVEVLSKEHSSFNVRKSDPITKAHAESSVAISDTLMSHSHVEASATISYNCKQG